MTENRPSKKQRELFNFIDSFIKENGYGPSYREVMRALDYRSVSTVAVHVDGLIARGLLRKKDNSARSLEVVGNVTDSTSDDIYEAWLRGEITKRVRTLERSDNEALRREIDVLREAAQVLGLGISTSPEV